MNSDLMSSSCDWITLKQRRISSLVVPNFFEKGLTILEVIFFIFVYFLYFFNLLHTFFFVQLFNIFLFNFLFFSINLLGYPIYSIFMRNAFNQRFKGFFFPWKIASNSSAIHFLHDLFFTLLMKQCNFLLVFGKKE